MKLWVYSCSFVLLFSFFTVHHSNDQLWSALIVGTVYVILSVYIIAEAPITIDKVVSYQLNDWLVNTLKGMMVPSLTISASYSF